MHVMRGGVLSPSSLEKFFHEQMIIILVLQKQWKKNVVPLLIKYILLKMAQWFLSFGQTNFNFYVGIISVCLSWRMTD